MPTPIVTQLIVDASGSKLGVDEYVATMERAKKAAVDASTATVTSFERAQQAMNNSLARTDPVIKAQIQMQQALTREQAIWTRAVELGMATQDAATAQLARVSSQYQVLIDKASGASKAQVAAAESVATFARGLNGAAGASNNLANSHATLSTQAMALSHSLRGAAEMLAQGVPPARVLAMELNNITYAATGPGGLAGAFKSLTQGALGTALKFAALASPLLILLGLMTATSVAAYKSAEANREFENSLAGIGRTGSASLADVDQAAKRTSASVGVSISQAQEWAQAYATTGKVGGDVLTGLTGITKQYAEATGKDTTDAVKALADAFADPAKGAQTLNDQLGFLNVTQMTHIKQLADEGDRLGAQKALYAELNKALDETANVHVHGLMKAWDDVWVSASNAWHAMVIAAGGGSLLDNLNKANKTLSDDLAKGWSENTDAIKADRAEVTAAKAAYDAFNTSLKKTQDQAAANAATTAAQPLIDKMFPDDATLRKLRADYDALGAAQKAAVAAGEPLEQYAKTTDTLLATGQAIGRLTEAYKEYGGSAGVAHQIAVLQAQAAATNDNATKGQIQTQIHELQTLGDLTPAQQRLTAAQDAGTVVADKFKASHDGVADSYAKTLAGLGNLTTATAKYAEEVANGTKTAQQAIDQEQIDKALKSQIAAIDTDRKLNDQQKLDMIQKLTNAQRGLNAVEDAADVVKQIAQIDQQTAAQTDLNDAVTSGKVSYFQTRDALIDYIQAVKDQAALDAAVAAHDDDKVATLTKLIALRKADTQVLRDAQDAGTIDQTLAQEREQLSLATMTSEQRERETAVLQLQHQLHGTLKQDNADELRDLVAQRQAAEQVGQAISGVEDADRQLADDVLNHKGNALKQWVDTIKEQYIRLLDWMAAQAIINPIVVPVFQSIVGSALGLVSGGAAGTQSALGAVGALTSGGSVAGSSGFLGQVSSQISSAANWLTSGINTLGSRLGFSGGTSFNGISTVGVTPSITGQGGFAAPNIAGSSSAFGGSTLTGTLGAGLAGFAVGNTINSAIGGNSVNGMIGGGIGGIAGAIIGGPIGSAIGSALGSIVGGLFGPAPSAHRATANFDSNYSLTGVTGTKLTAQGQQAALTAGTGVAQVVQALESAGLTLTNNISKLTISTSRDKSFITTTGGDRIDVGAVGDAQGAIQGTLNYLFDGLKSGDKDVQQVISHYKALGGLTADNAQQFGDDITFAQNLRETTHQVAVQLGNAADALAQLKTAYDADIERAKSLGLSTSQLIANEQKDIAAMQKATSAAYVAQFQGVVQQLGPQLDNYQSAAKALSDGLKQATSDMKALGGSVTAVTTAANAAKAALANTFNADIQSQIDAILKPVVTAYDQLKAAEAQNIADAKATGGSLALVNQLNAAETQKYIAGLSDADRATLISAGVLTAAQKTLAQTLTKVSDGLDTMIDNATATAQAAQQASQAWSSAQQSLDQSRKALLISGPGVSPQNAYLAAQQQYADLKQQSTTSAQAASDFASFASTFLQTSVAFNATGGNYGADYAMVQKDLASLSGLAGTQVTAADKLAAQAQASVDALNAIKTSLADGGPSLPILQQQLKAQQDLGTTMLSVLEQLGGHRAAGGPVSAGRSYLVGEYRAEMFTPSVSGYIAPHVASPSPARGPVANDNGVAELKEEIRDLKAALIAALEALGHDSVAAIVKTGGDTVKAVRELKSEQKHGTGVATLHNKHGKKATG